MTAQSLASYDAVVIGGGAAGLSAALALGRATRRVLLAACGPTRNAPASGAHNVFTRDGTPPAELVRIGREQLQHYDVVLRDECVTDVQPADNNRGYLVMFESGAVLTRGIVFATGVRDILPDIPGFKELWGRGVFHCPYCHGWEVAHQPLGIYARGEDARHLTVLLRGWTRDLVLFTDGDPQLSGDDLQRITGHGIVVRTERVQRLRGDKSGLDAVILKNGEEVPRTGLFLRPAQQLRSDLPLKLGCALTEQGRVNADMLGRTNVARVYVAGDIAPGHQSVPTAASSGALAGAGLNMELLTEDF